jgi:hypothetical protein
MVRKIAIGLAAAAIGIAGATSATLAQGQNQQQQNQENQQVRQNPNVQSQQNSENRQTPGGGTNLRGMRGQETSGGGGGIHFHQHVAREREGGREEGRRGGSKVHIHLGGGPSLHHPGVEERRVVEHRHISVPSTVRTKTYGRTYGRSCR